jgi:hypothetical protein
MRSQARPATSVENNAGRLIEILAIGNPPALTGASRPSDRGLLQATYDDAEVEVTPLDTVALPAPAPCRADAREATAVARRSTRGAHGVLPSPPMDVPQRA